nr:hypothetical protein [Gordonia sp. LAM0048]
MATVGDVVIGVGLLSVTPGAAGRTRHVEVSGTCEAGRIEPADVGVGDIVHMGSTGWPAAGAPEVFAATLRQRAAAAVVVDTDDDNLSAEFVSACVSHGVPIYMLPRAKSFRDVEMVVAPRAMVDDAIDESGPVASILASLGAFHRASGISGAVVLDGAVLTVPSATLDTDLLRKSTALPPRSPARDSRDRRGPAHLPAEVGRGAGALESASTSPRIDPGPQTRERRRRRRVPVAGEPDDAQAAGRGARPRADRGADPVVGDGSVGGVLRLRNR